jgi:hypothetical protein
MQDTDKFSVRVQYIFGTQIRDTFSRTFCVAINPNAIQYTQPTNNSGVYI